MMGRSRIASAVGSTRVGRHRDCELTNFVPERPVGFLIWMASTFRSTRIPERVQARLSLPPTPIACRPRQP